MCYEFERSNTCSDDTKVTRFTECYRCLINGGYSHEAAFYPGKAQRDIFQRTIRLAQQAWEKEQAAKKELAAKEGPNPAPNNGFWLRDWAALRQAELREAELRQNPK